MFTVVSDEHRLVAKQLRYSMMLMFNVVPENHGCLGSSRWFMAHDVKGTCARTFQDFCRAVVVGSFCHVL